MAAKSLANDTVDRADKTILEVEKNVHELTQRADKAVQDSLERLRVQGRVYAEEAERRLEDTQKYVVERVHEHPLTITFAALGVGMLLGLLMGGGRRR
jgi:ElaB/YqjD/DUF883 family membrane-anchored ribosome-binding protein